MTAEIPIQNSTENLGFHAKEYFVQTIQQLKSIVLVE